MATRALPLLYPQPRRHGSPPFAILLLLSSLSLSCSLIPKVCLFLAAYFGVRAGVWAKGNSYPSPSPPPRRPWRWAGLVPCLSLTFGQDCGMPCHGIDPLGSSGMAGGPPGCQSGLSVCRSVRRLWTGPCARGLGDTVFCDRSLVLWQPSKPSCSSSSTAIPHGIQSEEKSDQLSVTWAEASGQEQRPRQQGPCARVAVA